MKEKTNGKFVQHFVHRSNWIRAGVLGANDGILSTASIAIGVAAATDLRETIILATVAGVVAGALSMAAAEYVAVSSQRDIEQSDIAREKKELEEMPELELQSLAEIYENRGLKRETALTVAKELTAHDALGAHIRDELGLNEINRVNPLQAALASGICFTSGGGLPLLVVLFLPLKHIEYWLYASAILFLIILGGVAAKAGGTCILKASMRVTFWGTISMGLTKLIGHWLGVNM